MRSGRADGGGDARTPADGCARREFPARPLREAPTRDDGMRGGARRIDAPGSGNWSRRLRRVLGVNMLLSLVGVGVVVLAGEVWLRRSVPFVLNPSPPRFVPGVGLLYEPHGEARHTDLRDYWTISRANRLGFLDREPVTPERAASSCHLALVGDSFVVAREVEVPVKVQVQLEALAARERPDLDLTTSAFGIYGTSQVSQIPLYDAFVRPLRPKVVVLQATPNDYTGNSGALFEVVFGAPGIRSYARAERGTDGRIGLTLPDRAPPAARERSPFFLWNLLERGSAWGEVRRHRDRRRRYGRWRRLSGVTASLAGWRPPVTLGTGLDVVGSGLLEARGAGSGPAPAYAEALELTGFALDEFAARAARDGSHLVLFLHYFFGQSRDDAMEVLAEERGIPVVDQYRYITGAAGGNPADADFRRDMHWSPLGHRWAAEALWEYLEARPALCGPAEAGGAPPQVSPGSKEPGSKEPGSKAR